MLRFGRYYMFVETNTVQKTVTSADIWISFLFKRKKKRDTRFLLADFWLPWRGKDKRL